MPRSLHLHPPQAKLFTEAIQSFSKGIDTDPSNHILYSNRSGVYCAMFNYAKALQDAQKAVALKPDWAKAYSRVGAANHGLNNLEAAKEAYQKVSLPSPPAGHGGPLWELGSGVLPTAGFRT